MHASIPTSLALVFVVACGERRSPAPSSACDESLADLRAWGEGVDDRLLAHHQYFEVGVVAVPAAALDPFPNGRVLRVTIDADAIRVEGAVLTRPPADDGDGEDDKAWSKLAEAEQMADPVLLEVSPDAPWWRVPVAIELLRGFGLGEPGLVALAAGGIPRPPRADRARHPLPQEGRVQVVADWMSRSIQECPSLVAVLQAPSTPRELGTAAQGCGCRVDAVELSTLFDYVTLERVGGVLRVALGASLRPPQPRMIPDDASLLETLRRDLTVEVAGPGAFAARADATWGEVAPRLVEHEMPVALRILR